VYQSQDVSAFLLDFLRQTPGQTLTGTQLAQVLRIAYKDFSPMAHGCPNIRAFIAKFATPIREVGVAGADRVYSLNIARIQDQKSTVQTVPAQRHQGSGAASGFLDPAVWKTFVSPGAIFKLFANKDTGAVRVVRPNEHLPSEPWTQIPSLSSEFHRKIADDYAATLSAGPQRDAFVQNLAKPRWWDDIQAVTLQLGIAREWNGYRRTEILKRYNELLKSAGVSEQIGGDPSAKLRQVPKVTPAEQRSDARSPVDTSRLRDIILRAVARMSLSELRALAVPVGHIADELNLR